MNPVVGPPRSHPRRITLRPFLTLASLAGLVAAGSVSAHTSLPDKIETASERIASSSNPAAEFLLRGEFHRLSGQWGAAKADYDRAAALDPHLPGLDFCRAMLLFDQGDFAAAHAAITHVTVHEPDNGEAWKLRARAADALGRPLAGAEDLARAIAVLPDAPPDLYVERARLLEKGGSRAEALRCLDAGIARLGPIVTLELAAVDLEVARGSFAAALGRLDRVAAQMERPAKLQSRRAEILAAAGDREGARAARAAALADASAPPRRWRPQLDRVAGGATSVTPAWTPSGQAVPEARALGGAADTLVTRGPYLNIGAPTGVTIRWRTDLPSPSRVRYGSALGSLTSSVVDQTLTTEHEIRLTGLTPDRRYYYSIGTLATVLEGDDAVHTFVTSPPAGTPKATRIWVIGDAGTGTADQAGVRDAFTAYSGSRGADVWLMLGDNAYESGTDAEYQAKLFDMYEALLKNTIVWPTRGNHDAVRSGIDYYDVFSMPTTGQAGGLASGTEAYYSFDYGNIHFICLDSEGSDRTASGAMATWLQNDLAATARDWVIVYWHHPPYTKGSHDSDNTSDSGGRMRDMRANILPILESHGVDVVLTGHSHSYERSFLLDGHYGLSSTLTNAMKIDAGDGRESGDGPYVKPTLGTGPHEGGVYAVAGSSGKISGGSLNHPVMVSSLNVLGSMVVDIAGNRLDARFIDRNGGVRDGFTILKGSGPGPDGIRPAAITDLSSDPSGQTSAAEHGKP